MKKDKRALRVVDIATPTRCYQKAYLCWSDIFKRCYNEKWLQAHTTYHETEICDDWLRFSTFLKWHQSNYYEGWHLDKDLLGVGGLYSPNTCIFIPAEVNKFLTKSIYNGVTFCGRYMKFKAQLHTPDINLYKSFDNEDDARVYYKIHKLNRAESLEVKYKGFVPKGSIVAWVNKSFLPYGLDVRI